MNRFPLASVICALLFAASASAEIYQWKDDNGRTVFSDKPPLNRAHQQKKVDDMSPASPAPQKSSAEQELEFRKRQRDAQERTAKEQKEQAAATERQEYCNSMRRNLQSLESGERIVRRDDNGERSFLDDAQREQEIAKTRQSMQANCN